MQIEAMTVHGFGKWENRGFQFREGINLIVADNEAGKSTLLEAKIALLYGMKRDYVKKAIKREEWQRHLPWSSHAYGGKISYRIDGKHYILERNLYNDVHCLYDADNLRELSGDYPMDARKERNYMLEQIGLTRSLFEEITRIGTIGIDHHQQMVEWLHQQMGGIDEVAASYQDVFSLLEQKRREIGKGDTGKETRLAQANMKLKEAKEQLDQATHNMKHLRRIEDRIRHLESDIQRIHSQEDSFTSEVELEQLQQEKEQALLSKQQMERFLQDIERYQVEEDRLWGQLGHEPHKRDRNSLLQLMEQLQVESKQLDEDIQRCDERRAQLDLEIAADEQRLPLLLQQQQDYEKQKAKGKGLKKVRGMAYLIALAGMGMFYTLPWYFGLGASVIAIILFVYSLRSLSRTASQLDPDFGTIQDRLRRCQQERDDLYRMRLQLEQKAALYREREMCLNQLQQIEKRKRELLQHLQMAREVDQRFVLHWKVESSSDYYNEDLMIEAWVDRMRQIKREIEQLTHALEQRKQRVKELDQITHELAKLQGEMKNYQNIALEEKENIYHHALAEKEEWERKRGIIDLAGQLFRETLDEWNRMVSPDISKKASELFSMLTLGKYDQVRTDPSDRFRLRVVEMDQQAIREGSQLSRGTEQQLYFALRLALVDQFSKSTYLPIFLDDSFTHYDDRRLERALLVLEQFAGKHQIFLFSCQSREERLLRKLGIDYQSVQLSS